MTEALTTNYRQAPDPFDPPLSMFERAVATIKRAVRIEDYASELTDLFKSTESLRGICPIHGGENRSSFAVYPDRGRWYCFRCDEGGDVLDLCQRVEGHPQLWTAMVSLAQRFGVELPRRPRSWHDRQGEKVKIWELIVDTLTNSCQRRLFQVFGDLALENIEDPLEHEEEARRVFRDFRNVARVLARNRLERRRG